MCHMCTSFYCCHKCFQSLDRGIFTYSYRGDDNDNSTGYRNRDEFIDNVKKFNESSYKKILKAYCSDCTKKILLPKLEKQKYSFWIKLSKKNRTVIFSQGLEFKTIDLYVLENHHDWGYQSSWNTQSMMFVKFADHLGRVWSGKGKYGGMTVFLRKQKASPNEPI
jgi:hypothetical protein